MEKLTKHSSKRSKLVATLNEAAADYEISTHRVEKARKALAAVEEEASDKEREIRAEVEALFEQKMSEVTKGLNSAKSELGTAIKMRRKFGEAYVQARDKLAELLPELPEEEPAQR